MIDSQKILSIPTLNTDEFYRIISAKNFSDSDAKEWVLNHQLFALQVFSFKVQKKNLIRKAQKNFFFKGVSFILF